MWVLSVFQVSSVKITHKMNELVHLVAFVFFSYFYYLMIIVISVIILYLCYDICVCVCVYVNMCVHLCPEFTMFRQSKEKDNHIYDLYWEYIVSIIIFLVTWSSHSVSLLMKLIYYNYIIVVLASSLTFNQCLRVNDRVTHHHLYLLAILFIINILYLTLVSIFKWMSSTFVPIHWPYKKKWSSICPSLKAFNFFSLVQSFKSSSSSFLSLSFDQQIVNDDHIDDGEMIEMIFILFLLNIKVYSSILIGNSTMWTFCVPC